MKLQWKETATAQVEEIADYIALDKPGAAGKWVEAVHARARDAALFPFANRPVPEK